VQQPEAESWEEEGVARRAAPAASAEPALDPYAEPRRGLHVRLNDFELRALEHWSKREDTSKQRLIRRALRFWLEAQNGAK
jgi:hypothetical protein